MKIQKSRIFGIGKLLISTSLIIYLISVIDLGTVASRFESLQTRYLVIALCFLLGQSLLSTLKWRILLAADGISLKYVFLLKTYLIGSFFSLFLPTSFGGDVYRVIAVKNMGNDTLKTTSSVLFDRITGLLALISIAVFAYVVFIAGPYSLSVVLGYLIIIAGFWLGVSGSIFPKNAAAKKTWRNNVQEVFASFHVYSTKTNILLYAVLISLLFQFNIIVINKFYSLSIGLDIPFFLLATIIPIIYLTEAIPISINGLGVRESAFVLLYAWIGQSPESGLAISMLVIFMRYTTGLIGGSLFLISSVRGARRKKALD